MVSLDDNSLDKTVLQAAAVTLEKIEPGAKPVLLVAKDTLLYETQVELARTGKGAKELLPTLGPMLRGSGATHLILVTKLKHEARVQQIKDTLLGSGMLEGLGFYVDTGRPAPECAAGTARSGRPRALRLLQARAHRPRQGRGGAQGAGGRLSHVHESETGNAWTALSNHEKIQVLQDIISAKPPTPSRTW
jgi:hypothetical protein